MLKVYMVVGKDQHIQQPMIFVLIIAQNMNTYILPNQKRDKAP